VMYVVDCALLLMVVFVFCWQLFLLVSWAGSQRQNKQSHTRRLVILARDTLIYAMKRADCDADEDSFKYPFHVDAISNPL
jgi:hypothetical protein